VYILFLRIFNLASLQQTLNDENSAPSSNSDLVLDSFFKSYNKSTEIDQSILSNLLLAQNITINTKVGWANYYYNIKPPEGYIVSFPNETYFLYRIKVINFFNYPDRSLQKQRQESTILLPRSCAM
jgi:hypothetical protein